MKIGFVAQPTDEVPSVHGASISLWIQEVATRLARQHAVIVYSRRTGQYPDTDEHGGVRHVRISTETDERIIAGVRRVERLLGRVLRRSVELFYRFYYFSRLYYAKYIDCVCGQAIEDGVDVLVVSNYSQFLPHLRRRHANIKIALMMQCDWMVELPRHVAEKRGRCANVIMGCSEYIAEGVRRRLPALSDRCHTLYNGSSEEALRRDASELDDVPELRTQADEKVVLFVGRITPEKGLHVLIEAMGPLLKRCPSCVLMLAGGFHINPPRPRSGEGVDAAAATWESLKGDYEGHLRRKAAPFGNQVRFVGHVPHHQLWALYNNCDVFVHPSLWNEPFGMILTEAMLCERAVVSTRTGGIPEIVVDGETGRLVETVDPGSLAAAIGDLLDDDDLRIAMGRAGRQRVEQKFTWDHTAKRLNSILTEVVAGQ